MELEVSASADAEDAMFSVQPKTWFDERIMLEYIDTCWVFIVNAPCILLLYSSRVHRSATVASRLAGMGLLVLCVPSGRPVLCNRLTSAE